MLFQLVILTLGTIAAPQSYSNEPPAYEAPKPAYEAAKPAYEAPKSPENAYEAKPKPATPAYGAPATKNKSKPRNSYVAPANTRCWKSAVFAKEAPGKCTPDQCTNVSDSVFRDGKCFQPCPPGHYGVGGVCFKNCPSKYPVFCGATCAKDDASCPDYSKKLDVDNSNFFANVKLLAQSAMENKTCDTPLRRKLNKSSTSAWEYQLAAMIKENSKGILAQEDLQTAVDLLVKHAGEGTPIVWSDLDCPKAREAIANAFKVGYCK